MPETSTNYKESCFAKGYAHVMKVSSQMSSAYTTLSWLTL
jgi:hypothetical protein